MYGTSCKEEAQLALDIRQLDQGAAGGMIKSIIVHQSALSEHMAMWACGILLAPDTDVTAENKQGAEPRSASYLPRFDNGTRHCFHCYSDLVHWGSKRTFQGERREILRWRGRETAEECIRVLLLILLQASPHRLHLRLRPSVRASQLN